ncbi:MAG: glycosyltransferase [Chlamydiae bacterium]|nr:glycosyltransferase [Chlamydiota bacterium]
MLTFVYCSEKKDLAKEKRWVESSGLENVEVLWYKGDAFSKSYNKGLNQAKHDVIIFLREDVELPLQGWGEKILERFETTQFGVLGVVGSIIVPMSGLVWEKEEPLVGRIWYESFDKQHEQKFSESFSGKVIPVVALDDSLFAVYRPRLANGFDEQFISDSFYDLDFYVCNYQKRVKIGVIFDIKVLKLGLNPQNEEWVENRNLFVKKHHELPLRLKPEIFITNTQIKIVEAPKVAVFIPSKGKPVELASCLESIYEQTNYPNIDIFIVDLGSSDEDLQAIREFIQIHKNTQLIEMKHEHLPSIYEEIIDDRVSADTELFLFCNPEVIFLNDVISRMVKTYQEDPENCGTLGIRMHTRNNMVRHFGLQLISTHTDEGYELGLGYVGFQSAYKYQNKVVRGVLGSSRDVLMVSKKLYRELGGFNKEYMHSLEDFELNLKAILLGKKNVIVGTGVCYFLGQDMPKFLPSDFERLIAFINEHVENITPYVDLLYAA